ncbi:hypothetical protein MRX96_034568 [Rhipicephalus microplus]
MLSNPFCFGLQVLAVLQEIRLSQRGCLPGIKQAELLRRYGPEPSPLADYGISSIKSPHTTRWPLRPSSVTSHHVSILEATKGREPASHPSGPGSSTTGGMLSNPFCFVLQVLAVLQEIRLSQRGCLPGIKQAELLRRYGPEPSPLADYGISSIKSPHTTRWPLRPSSVTSHHVSILEATKGPDCWTASNRSFLGVTVQHIDEESLERRSAALVFQRLSGHHTYDVITTALHAVFVEYKILHKMCVVITDNGSNFVKAFKVFGEAERDQDFVANNIAERSLPPLEYCTPLASSLQDAVKKRFSEVLEDADLALAAAVHPKFKLSWMTEARKTATLRLLEKECHALEAIFNENAAASEGTDEDDCNEFCK